MRPASPLWTLLRRHATKGRIRRYGGVVTQPAPMLRTATTTHAMAAVRTKSETMGPAMSPMPMPSGRDLAAWVSTDNMVNCQGQGRRNRVLWPRECSGGRPGKHPGE